MATKKHFKVFLLAAIAAALFPAGVFAVVSSPGQRSDKARFKVSAAVSAKAGLTPSSTDYMLFRDFKKKVSGKWEMRYNPRTGAPAALTSGGNLRYPGEAVTAARKFFTDYKTMLKIDPDQLQLQSSMTVLGITHLLYKQYYNGVPVEGGMVKLHIDTNGGILAVHSNFTPGLAVSASPRITARSAASAAASDAGGQADKSGTLVIWPSEDGVNHLAWKVGAAAGGITGGRWDYYVDANTGVVLTRISRIKYASVAGYVGGTVYQVAPNLTDWSNYSAQPISNEYVWVQGYSTRTVTGSILTATPGQYSSTLTGKVFSGLKGPYFSVANFQHPSAHYDNGNGMWGTVTATAASPDPYTPGAIYESTVTLALASISTTCYNPSLPYFAKVLPHFSKMDVGVVDSGGSITTYDELHVLDASNREKEASYIGTRVSALTGAPVENPSYVMQLDAGSSGSATQHGYRVDVSSFLYLPSNTGTGCSAYDPTATNNVTSTFTWTAARSYDTATGYTGLDEVNAFYHLNAMHDFYNTTVNSTGGTESGARLVNLDVHMPVMVHVSGQPDSTTPEFMNNAFYDNESQNIMIGDGNQDSYMRYLTFSLDATVIRHEYTHFVTDTIYPRIYEGESGAISEGLSDYFSLSSLYTSDTTMTPLTSLMGEFMARPNTGGAGTESTGARDLGLDCVSSPDAHCTYPDDWDSEVHDDSLMLTRSLWMLRNPASSKFIGILPASTVPGITRKIPRSDFYVFNSLLFYPDTFLEFRDDMVMVCKQMAVMGYETCTSSTSVLNAFSAHGISAPRAGGDIYESNDGVETASDITNIASLSANIYPAYDVDFYTLALPAGPVSFNLALPPSATQTHVYHVLDFGIFDSSMNELGEVMPIIKNPSLSGVCPSGSECITDQSAVTLDGTLAKAGRYYLRVQAGPGEYGNSADYSTTTYSLSRQSSVSGSGSGSISTALYDNDKISFSVPVNFYGYNSSPLWLSTMTAQVEGMDYAQLLDHNMNLLPGADTKTATYLKFDSSATANSTITGYLEIMPGFAKRYPAVGTVYVEIFGSLRYTNVITGVNSSTQAVSLGISSAINLTASVGDFRVWNNIFNPDKGNACTIRYDAIGAGGVTIKVFTPDGTLVRTLMDASVGEGKGSFDWDGANDNGSRVAAGMYIVHGKGPGFDNLRKVVVIR